jgi:hypothetical protein
MNSDYINKRPFIFYLVIFKNPKQYFVYIYIYTSLRRIVQRYIYIYIYIYIYT